MIKLKTLLEAKYLGFGNQGRRPISEEGKGLLNPNTIINVTVEDIHPEQHPEYEDAYISYAEDDNGDALNDDILDKLNYDDEYSDWKYQQVMDYIDMHRGQDLR